MVELAAVVGVRRTHSRGSASPTFGVELVVMEGDVALIIGDTCPARLLLVSRCVAAAGKESRGSRVAVVVVRTAGAMAGRGWAVSSSVATETGAAADIVGLPVDKVVDTPSAGRGAATAEGEPGVAVLRGTASGGVGGSEGAVVIKGEP